MSGDSQDDGTPRWYTRNFGQPRFPEEVTGYWVSALGAVLSLVGVLVFLLGTTAGHRTPLFWTALQAATVFGGAGVPLLILGFVYRLPVPENVYRLAVSGVVVCLFALVAFLVFYPDRWNVSPASPAPDRSSQVTAVYAVGLLFSVFSATVLPTITPKRDEIIEEESVDTEAGFEVYRDVSADWRWKLRDPEGDTVVDSDVGYPTEEEAERGIEAFRDDVMGASVETRDVLEEYLLSGKEGEGVGVVEKEGGKRAIKTGTGTETKEAEGTGTGVRYELHEEEGIWGWRLLDRDDAVAVSGEGYGSRADAVEAVEFVRGGIDEAEVVETDPACVVVYRDEAGNWRWRLVRGGETVAVCSQGYVESDGVETAVERLRSGEGTVREVYEDTEGWRWRLVHTNGEVLAESKHTYEDEDDAEAAVETATELLADAGTAEVGDAYFVVYTADGGDLRWTILSRKGSALAVSEKEYGELEEVLNDIESVRTHATEAPVVG